MNKPFGMIIAIVILGVILSYPCFSAIAETANFRAVKFPIPANGKEVLSVTAISKKGLAIGTYKDQQRETRSFIWNVRSESIEDLGSAIEFSPIGFWKSLLVGVVRNKDKCSIQTRTVDKISNSTPFKKSFCRARAIVSLDRNSFVVLSPLGIDTKPTSVFKITRSRVVLLSKGYFSSVLGVNSLGEVVISKSSSNDLEFLLVNPSTKNSRLITISTGTEFSQRVVNVVLSDGRALGWQVRCSDTDTCTQEIILIDPLLDPSVQKTYMTSEYIEGTGSLSPVGISSKGEIFATDFFFNLTVQQSLVGSTESGESLILSIVNDRTKDPFQLDYFDDVKVEGKYISSFVSKADPSGTLSGGAHYLLIRE